MHLLTLQPFVRRPEVQTPSRVDVTRVAQVPCHSCIVSELTSIFLALSLRPLPQRLLPFPKLFVLQVFKVTALNYS